jgi:hypothetical protein
MARDKTRPAKLSSGGNIWINNFSHHFDIIKATIHLHINKEKIKRRGNGGKPKEMFLTVENF